MKNNSQKVVSSTNVNLDVFNDMPLAVAFCNEDFELLCKNKAWTKIFGDLTDLKPIAADFPHLGQDGDESTVEIKSAEEKLLKGRLVRVSNENILGYYILLDLNLGLRDSHQSKLATLGTLMASIIHEINNPIAVVNTSAMIIEKNIEKKGTIDSEKLISLTKSIRGSIDRIVNLVDSLKNFSRSEESQISEINFQELVLNNIQFLAPLFKKEGIKINTDSNLDADVKILGKRSELGQVIINILSNAKDAMKGTKGKQIDVFIKSAGDGAKDSIKLIIRDHGTGIPKEVQPKIFDEYFTTKKESEGTGLGMSIVKKIVENHAGHIEFETRLEGSDSGTDFIISFPVVSLNR